MSTQNASHIISAISHTTATFDCPFTKLIDYNGTSNATYVGFAVPGSSQSDPKWAIQFIQYDGNNNATSITWSSNYAILGDVWANRATLSYS